MACGHCEAIAGKKRSAKLYDDGKLAAFLAEQPAAVGHIIIAPKEHMPIVEALSDSAFSHLAKVTNKISVAVFEAIKCEGTNILIQNGIEAGQEEPHACVNIIARKTGDGLMFEWAPKQLSEEEMSTVELQLKEALERKEPAAEEPEEKAAEPEAQEPDALKEKEENYLIKQLRRMP
ncbi:MAG: HIT family protein [Nanoarchaeota archaeon]|nr:HIT family protein [Nanoarchaeota archaeon]